MATAAVGAKEVPAALMLTERFTVPAASETNWMVAPRESVVMRPPRSTQASATMMTLNASPLRKKSQAISGLK